MSTSAAPASPQSQPPSSRTSAPAPPAPPHAGEAPGGGLDLEEDVAPNLGGEDQMQDA
jgi:hypothetical protein